MKRGVTVDRSKKLISTFAQKLKAKGSDEQELTHILNAIEGYARSSGTSIVSMRPKPSADMGYYKRFIVEIETESDMSSLMKFIFEVKRSPQLLKIEKLNLNSKSSQGGVIIRASMIISKIALK